jgi:hypothetical protein
LTSFDSETRESAIANSMRPLLETNHERTLYVPYVFRNHLILRQRNQFREGAAQNGDQSGSRNSTQADPAAAAGANGARITSARAAARFPNNELS